MRYTNAINIMEGLRKAAEGSMVVGLKVPLSWLGRFGASASQAFMSCDFANPSVEQ